MILKEFNKIKYDDAFITDIFRPLNFYSDQFKTDFIPNKYVISGDDRPENLAYVNSNNPELTWIYLLENNITDPFWGWVANETDIRNLSERRYVDADDIHHYIHTTTKEIWYDIVENPISSGNWFDVGDTLFTRIVVNGVMIPVTNYEYEINLNENKRNIKTYNKNSFVTYDSKMKKTIRDNVDVNSK